LRPLSSADRQETLYSLQIPGANATVIVKQGVYSDTREPHFQKEAIPIILKGVSEILRRVLIVSNWQQKMPGCPVRLEISKDLELFVISGGGGERFLDDGTAYIGTDIGMMRDPRLFRSIPGLEPRFYSSNEFDHYLNAERILTVPS
jgi:hypothetical protein